MEAKFDGETLRTDPIDHTERPNFSTELAWELDKKALHQHKLQRTPIKLQCFAIDTILSQKEMVGYIILDLRAAQAKLQRPQWFPLLNSKYQRLKPEIQVMLNLEDDSLKKPEQSSPPQHSTPSGKDDIDPLALQPVLNEDNGFYQLGPNSESSEIFVLSVTISYAVHLAKLIPSSFVVPDGQGFYFQYSLFGNNVSSDIFSDLLQPNFSPERASVRINSQLQVIRVFLENFPGIKITLYCGGRPLGTTNISLHSLLAADEPLTSPALLEALFPLKCSDDEEPRFGSNEFPAVGVSITLRKDETNATSTQELHTVGDMRLTSGNQGAGEEHSRNKSRPEIPDITPQNDGKLQVEEAEAAKILPHAEPSDKKADDSRLSFHHFCYSIDLRSICDLQVTSSVNCYLKYSYPFFGSAAPVITSPPVEVRRHMEVLLPKSFCAFDFATNPEVLKETLSSVPLVIEVWHRDPLTKDALLGVARVTLGHVFAAKKLKAARGKPSTYGQILSEKVHIIADDRKPIGELNVVMGLEDLGPVPHEHLQARLNGSESFSSVESPKRKSPSKAGRENARGSEPSDNDPRNTDPRMTAEYQTALEIEMWKQQQEELFTAQLKAKEVEKIKTLTEEWRKRDKEREILTKKKLEEYSQLEEKLKKTIIDIEKRERQLSASETELLRTKEEQRREHERKMVELREASRRMKEDCEHQIEMERAKVREAEDQKQSILLQLRDMEKRYQDKERELLNYKEQQLSKPEVKLEAELSLLRVEKVELERKLESANKSKIHYKQQWGKALKELGKVKQNEQTAAKARLKQQEKELEEMRLRFLASQEKEIANTERKELEDIKNELNRLKDQERSKHQETTVQQEHLRSQQEAAMFAAREREEMQRKEELDSKIAKLIEERDTLLQTGVYTTEDRIIAELDRQIREAIASKT